MQNPQVFVTRTLNMKKIKWLGFDLDHTLVRYKTENFEALTHGCLLQKLVENLGYPEDIKKLRFDYDRMIRGLVLDTKRGNILKLNRHAGIRDSYHGTKKIDFAEQKRIYHSTYVDLGDPEFATIDTAFSLSHALLFAQLVDMKDEGYSGVLPEYDQIARDIGNSLDQSHRDGTLKSKVQANPDKYLLLDPQVAEGLEVYKKQGKKLFVVTNSGFDYAKFMMDTAINPYLQEHKSWLEIFDYVVVSSKKPRFFYDHLDFLKVDPETGNMRDHFGPLDSGVYYGGCATAFEDSIGVRGDEILYVGDHIYGDVVRLKIDCNWRTALVIDELESELAKYDRARPIEEKIQKLMAEKLPLENEQHDILTQSIKGNNGKNDPRIKEIQAKTAEIDEEISKNIVEFQKQFNPYWGEVMRVGNEESFFANQVDQFAGIYCSKLSDLLAVSPRAYLRAKRRPMAHEI
jgi:HAD superfamily 5'-nucleotidase-like hydrolase